MRSSEIKCSHLQIVPKVDCKVTRVLRRRNDRMMPSLMTEAKSAALSRTQLHSVALSRTQSHTVAIRRTQAHSGAISCNQSQSASPWVGTAPPLLATRTPSDGRGPPVGNGRRGEHMHARQGPPRRRMGKGHLRVSPPHVCIEDVDHSDVLAHLMRVRDAIRCNQGSSGVIRGNSAVCELRPMRQLIRGTPDEAAHQRHSKG